MAEKNVTLSINKEELKFNVTSENFNRFINDTTADNKVVPAKQFLRRSLVDTKQREQLDNLCDRGLTMDLVAKLVEDFRGDVEIEIKKSSAGSSN